MKILPVEIHVEHKGRSWVVNKTTCDTEPSHLGGLVLDLLLEHDNSPVGLLVDDIKCVVVDGRRMCWDLPTIDCDGCFA